MELIAKRDCKNKHSRQELGTAFAKRIGPEHPPREETQRGVLKQMSGLSPDNVPQVYAAVGYRRKQKANQWIEYSGGVSKRKVVRGQTGDDSDPETQGNPIMASLNTLGRIRRHLSQT